MSINKLMSEMDLWTVFRGAVLLVGGQTVDDDTESTQSEFLLIYSLIKILPDY